LVINIFDLFFFGYLFCHNAKFLQRYEFYA
jgi:hypothetical protein